MRPQVGRLLQHEPLLAGKQRQNAPPRELVVHLSDVSARVGRLVEPPHEGRVMVVDAEHRERASVERLLLSRQRVRVEQLRQVVAPQHSAEVVLETVGVGVVLEGDAGQAIAAALAAGTPPPPRSKPEGLG